MLFIIMKKIITFNNYVFINKKTQKIEREKNKIILQKKKIFFKGFYE